MRTFLCRLTPVSALVFLALGVGAASYGADMKIGFAQVNINPPVGVPMGWQRFEGIESDFFVSAMSVSDGTAEIVMVSCDVGGVSNEKAARLCRKIEEAIGVPTSNIMVCATHTHSGPPTNPSRGNEVATSYSKKFEESIVQAAIQAHENARKGKLTLGFGELPGYGFNRRFIMSDRTIQTHPLTLDPHIVAPEGPDSKNVFVFCAYDENGKPMGAAVNFTCHSTVMERRNRHASSDYPGKLCRFVSEKLGPGTISLFLQGPCGNICQVNPLDATHMEVGAEWTRVMGRAIGGKAVELIENSSIETTGRLRTLSRKIELTLRKPDPVLVQWAINHENVPATGFAQSDFGAERHGKIELPKLALNDWFEQPSWANSYASTVKSHARNNARTAKITAKVFAQDNWALVSLPGEFFIEFGNDIQRRSPFEKTVVVGYANGSNGYFPTRKAFSRGGGYETNIGTARFTPDAGYLVVDAVLEMLQTVRDQ